MFVSLRELVAGVNQSITQDEITLRKLLRFTHGRPVISYSSGELFCFQQGWYRGHSSVPF
jgi:hypothetical protein